MKQLRVLLLPPGWDGSPSQGYLKHYGMLPVPILCTPVWREIIWSKLPYPRKPHVGRDQASRPYTWDIVVSQFLFVFLEEYCSRVYCVIYSCTIHVPVPIALVSMDTYYQKT